MRRRDVLRFLGGAALLWPKGVWAQQPAMPVIGFVYIGSSETNANLTAAFRQGLSETGYFEGQNVKIEYRWAQHQVDRLPAIIAELVRTAADPVKNGLVASLNRPGGNVTGISYMNVEIGAKRFGLLNELAFGHSCLAILIIPDSASTQLIVNDLQMAASKIGRQVEFFAGSSPTDIDLSFAKLAEKHCGGLLVTPMPLFFDLRFQILSLAARYAIPAIYPAREWAEAGGIMSYGSSFGDQFRQAGIYTGRILGGKTPADLPVLQPTKFELVINLQTAHALGVKPPPNLLTIADEVIE